MPASTHGDEVRDSLRRIARILLDTSTFWRCNKLCAQLRTELEGLLRRIDSIDPGSACDYAFAFSELSRHMPDGIERLCASSISASSIGTVIEKAAEVPNKERMELIISSLIASGGLLVGHLSIVVRNRLADGANKDPSPIP